MNLNNINILFSDCFDKDDNYSYNELKQLISKKLVQLS